MAISKTENVVCQEYNRLAPIHDTRWRNCLNRSLAFLLDFAEIPPEAAILDLACGTGKLARLILENNPQQTVTSREISSSCLLHSLKFGADIR